MTIPKILEIGKNLPEMSTRYARRKTAERIIDYVLSLGMDEINSEQEKILIESLSEDLKIDLKNRVLFKPFISNGIKVNPELRDNWKIDYRLQDIHDGMITLFSEGSNGNPDIFIQRVPVKNLLDVMKTKIMVDNELKSFNIKGDILQQPIIINNFKKFYSKAFYDLWLKLNSENDNNTVTKDNLTVGNYYQLGNSGNQISLEKYLGKFSLVNFIIQDGKIIPKIAKQNLAFQFSIGTYNFDFNLKEFDLGYIHKLPPLKKLSYNEELQNLPFLEQMSREEEFEKIKTDIMQRSKNTIDVLQDTKISAKNISFRIVPVDVYGHKGNIILYNGLYLLSDYPLIIQDHGSYTFRPKYILTRASNGELQVSAIGSQENMRRYPEISEFIRVENSTVYTLAAIINNQNSGIQFEDGINI